MNAAVVLRRSTAPTADQEEGALLDLACDGDVARGCAQLAEWLARHGAAPEVSRTALDKACRLGAAEACREKPEVQEL
jgi:hypothetical protein